MFVAPRACFSLIFSIKAASVSLAVGTLQTISYGECRGSVPRAPLQLPHWLIHVSSTGQHLVSERAKRVSYTLWEKLIKCNAKNERRKKKPGTESNYHPTLGSDNKIGPAIAPIIRTKHLTAQAEPVDIIFKLHPPRPKRNSGVPVAEWVRQLHLRSMDLVIWSGLESHKSEYSG